MNSPYSSDARAHALSHPLALPQSFDFDALRNNGSHLVALLIGASVLFKALDILGFPVWLWLHRILTMASEIPSNLALTLYNPRPSSPDSDNDSGSALSNMFSAGSGLLGKGLSGVTGALSKNYRNVPAGLGNWDNSCYQNSVIQGLASLPSLREYLARTTGEFEKLGEDSTNGALFDMVDKLNDPKNHGQNFWIKGKLKSMSTFQQQDAQEYYSKILDELDKEVKSARAARRRSSASLAETVASLGDGKESGKEEEEAVEEDAVAENAPEEKEDVSTQPQVAPNPLDGLLAQRVGCVNCGYTEGLSLIPFNCITMPLGRAWAYDVRDCLNEYTNLELIEGVECAKCTLLKMEKTTAKLAEVKPEIFGAKLQTIKEVLQEEDYEDKTLIKRLGLSKKVWVQSTKSRQAVIARAPKSLVLHVNRSIFDEMTGAQYKNNANVMYPKILDLKTWCLGSKPSESDKPDEEVEESWPRDPNKTMLGEVNAESAEDSPFRYALRAAITHWGNHGNGHYICYRQHAFATEAPKPDEEEKTSDDGEKEEIEKEEVEKEEVEKEEVVKEEEDSTEEKVAKEQWWRLSDENVYEVHEDDALRQQNVFMLFYERIDPNASSEDLVQNETAEARSDVPLASEDAPAERQVHDAQAFDIPPPEDDEQGAKIELPLTPPESPRMAPVPAPLTPTSETTTSATQPDEISAPVTPPPEPQSTDTADSSRDNETTASRSSASTHQQPTSDPDLEPESSARKRTNSTIKMRTAGDVTGVSDKQEGMRMVSAL